MTESESQRDRIRRDFDPLESLILSFKYDPKAEVLFIAIRYTAEIVDEYFRHRMVEGKSPESFRRHPTDFRGLYFTGVNNLTFNNLKPEHAGFSWPDIESTIKRQTRAITLFEQTKLKAHYRLILEANHGFDMQWTYDNLVIIQKLALGEDTDEPEKWIYRDVNTGEIVDPESPFGEDWVLIERLLDNPYQSKWQGFA